MNPIFDTALLKHHRLAHGPRIKWNDANRPTPRRRRFGPTLVTLACGVLLIGAISSVSALS